jgi:tetratricopeptide (TPR) repeat protein
MTFDFLRLPPDVAERLGLPRDKSVPVTPEMRAAVAGGDPPVEAVVRGCEAYLAVDPEDLDYRRFLRRWYHRRGVLLANAGRVEEAFELFARARLFDGTDAQAHLDYARAAAELERPEEAIEGCRAAMAAGEKSPALYDQLARAFAQKGDFRSARTAAEEARRLFPEALEPLHTMATVLYHAGDKAEVEKVLFEALTRAPDDALTLEKLAVWMRECGRHGEAARILRRAMQVAPGEPRLLYQRGMIEMRSGDRAAAERTFREALAARPGDLDSRTALGVLLLESSRVPEAEQVFSETAARAPDDYRAHFHLGRLCCRDGARVAEGLRHFARVLDLAPRDRHAVHYIHAVASNAGDAPLAARAEERMRAMGESPRQEGA